MQNQAYQKLKKQNSHNNDEATDLYTRWHAIRLNEISRQLKLMSDRSLYFVTHTQSNDANAICIPKHVLELPIELMAAIAAFQWGEKMNLSRANQKDDSELFNFVHQFLKKYNYPVERIVRFLLTQKQAKICEKYAILQRHLSLFILSSVTGKTHKGALTHRVKLKPIKRTCVLPLIV